MRDLFRRGFFKPLIIALSWYDAAFLRFQAAPETGGSIGKVLAPRVDSLQMVVIVFVEMRDNAPSHGLNNNLRAFASNDWCICSGCDVIPG